MLCTVLRTVVDKLFRENNLFLCLDVSNDAFLTAVLFSLLIIL